MEMLREYLEQQPHGEFRIIRMKHHAENIVKRLFHQFIIFKSRPVTAVDRMAALLYLLIIYDLLIAPQPLGLIESGIRMREQCLIVLSMFRGERDADTASQLYLIVIMSQLAAHGVAQSVTARQHLAPVSIRHEDDELVSAYMSQDILRTKVHLQCQSQVDNYGITDEMPEFVIDLLEMVDIQDKQCMMAIALPVCLQSLIDNLWSIRFRIESGHGIMLQAFLQLGILTIIARDILQGPMQYAAAIILYHQRIGQTVIKHLSLRGKNTHQYLLRPAPPGLPEWI